MPAWSQLTSLGFSLLGFAVAARAQPEGASRQSRRFHDHPAVARLRAFPPFWAGLALLVYISIQGLNPSWRYLSNAESWWLEPTAHLSWLPSGVNAPFARSNPWRSLVVFGSLWLLICSVWIGFNHRKSYRLLFTILAGNTFLLCLLGMLQQLTAAKKIFWSYLPSNEAFVSSFIYRNHAGAYLNLMVALMVGLAWWYDQRAQRRMDKSSPAAVLTFLAVFAAIMVIFSYSRGSILLLLAFTLLLAGVFVLRLIQRRGSGRNRTEVVALALVLTSFMGIGLVSMRAEKVWTRFADLAADPAGNTRQRTLAREAATDMLRDRWLLGWGAGCFRHGFPLYAQYYPAIYVSENGRRKYWEHAHNDVIQFPLELGVLGLLPFVGAMGCGAWQLIRHRVWRNPLALPLSLGCGLLLLHGWIDFVFQNPAVLLTWGVLFIGAVRWVQLEQPRAVQPSRAARV